MKSRRPGAVAHCVARSLAAASSQRCVTAEAVGPFGQGCMLALRTPGITVWLSCGCVLGAMSSGTQCSCPGLVGGYRALCLLIQTTLCNTSLDNPTQRNKDQLIQAAVKFLDTDTIW